MTVLESLLRVVRLWAMALWVGGIVFFIAVAQVAFTNLPTTHEAGLVVRGSLTALHRMGTVEGVVYVVCTALLLLMGSERRTLLRGVEMGLVVIMLVLTYSSQHSIIPTMERDRIALYERYGTEVDGTPRSDPAHAEFDRLHGLSTQVEGFVLLAGLATLALGRVADRWQR